MARQFEACMIDLAATGLEKEKAIRACSAAFWAANGMLPEDADERGFDPPGSCTQYAYALTAQLSAEAKDADLSGVFYSAGPISPVAQIDAFFPFTMEGEGEPETDSEESEADPLDCEDRYMVEVQMLAPGKLIDATGKEFEFTPDDMQAYVDNFSPTDHPPILLDHVLSASGTVGRLRSLRVQQPGSVLMGLWEILGEENVKPVKDGRWSRTSGRFVQSSNRESKIVIEGSIVWSGAYDRGFGDRAQILSRKKGNKDMSIPVKKAVLAAPPVEEVNEVVEVAVAAAEPAPVAIVEAPAQVADAAAVMAKYEERIAMLEARDAENSRVIKLQADTTDVLALIEAGKSVPANQEQELAVLSGMPADLRPKYLALRQSLPSVWPTGGRQSVAVANAPGHTAPEAVAKAELDEFATLGADMGFAPAKPAAAK